MRWIKLYSHLLCVTFTPPWHWLWTHAHGHRSTPFHLPTSMSGAVYGLLSSCTLLYWTTASEEQSLSLKQPAKPSL
eukprot:4051667-Prymnesium_polylepis.1